MRENTVVYLPYREFIGTIHVLVGRRASNKLQILACTNCFVCHLLVYYIINCHPANPISNDLSLKLERIISKGKHIEACSNSEVKPA